jgi:phosphinothricin acetyltransferase
MSACTVRSATREDAAAINDIQNYYVEHSTATFLTEPLTLEERLSWYDEHGEVHPVTVAVSNRSVVGWGALGTFRPRAAYRRTAELSVYVHHDWHRRGIGRAIVSDLLERAAALDYHALVGGCCSEAEPSIALLEALGFSRVAHFPEVGRKFDRWLDVVFVQRLVTEARCPPA